MVWYDYLGKYGLHKNKLEAKHIKIYLNTFFLHDFCVMISSMEEKSNIFYRILLTKCLMQMDLYFTDM